MVFQGKPGHNVVTGYPFHKRPSLSQQSGPAPKVKQGRQEILERASSGRRKQSLWLKKTRHLLNPCSRRRTIAAHIPPLCRQSGAFGAATADGHAAPTPVAVLPEVQFPPMRVTPARVASGALFQIAAANSASTLSSLNPTAYTTRASCPGDRVTPHSSHTSGIVASW